MTDKPICLFDMDGTLFDYDKTMKEKYKTLMSPEETFPTDLSWSDDHETPNHVVARVKLIRSQPGFWKNLPILDKGHKILIIAKEIGYDCHILTKGPKSHPLAWMEKVQAIQHHYGDMDIDIVGRDKSHRYGRVLVDDWPLYIDGWLKHRPRGLAILPTHPWNSNYTHPNAIHYDGTDTTNLEQHLKAAYVRKDKERWII